MSLTISTDVVCDLCANWTHGTTNGGTRGNPAVARRVAQAQGWQRRRLVDECLPGYRIIDVCDQCIAAELSTAVTTT